MKIVGVKNRGMRKYEIWIGYYHLGQGYDPPTKPEKLSEVEATSFRIACVIYEHQSSIDSLKERMKDKNSYIEDIHFGGWDYHRERNSNSWTGKYYESEQEALKSFN